MDLRKTAILAGVSFLLAGCGANLPRRTGYDRATGTWKIAGGGKAKRQKATPAAAAAKVDPSSVSDPKDTATPVDSEFAAPLGTKLSGQASFYGKEFVGRPTASGEPYDPDALTCAHRTLPFGTRLKVDYPKKGLSTTVRVNDRGPQKDGRILDLSRAAADDLGLTADGVGAVEAEVVP